MTTKTLCLVGAGRAGGSLARHWHTRQSGFTVTAIHTRRGSPDLARSIDADDASQLQDLPDTDALLIATDDQSINAIAHSLALQSKIDWRDKIVFHLSGALSADCLGPLAALGAKTASAHPVRAFSHDHSVFDGTWVGLEGNATACSVLEGAFGAIGGQCFEIDSEHKTKYHAAAVIASNHLVALADASYDLWRQAGLEPETAAALFDSLTRGVLENLKNAKPAQALTGPIARADATTVAAHIHTISEHSEQTAKLYRQLSEYLLKLDLGHDDIQLSALRQAIEKP